MIPCMRLLGAYCERHLLMTQFWVFTVNQPVLFSILLLSTPILTSCTLRYFGGVVAFNKNPAMSPSSSSHCGQYDTMYAAIGCVLRKAFADDTFLGVNCEPARKEN